MPSRSRQTAVLTAMFGVNVHPASPPIRSTYPRNVIRAMEITAHASVLATEFLLSLPYQTALGLRLMILLLRATAADLDRSR